MSEPLLSICICVRNGEKHLGRCLESVQDATEKFQTPIYVINHLSTDGTLELIKEWKNKMGARLVAFDFKGRGLGAVRDFAWRQTNTPWIAFIDSDCVMTLDWARQAYQAIKAYDSKPQVAAFGGNNSAPKQNSLFYDALTLSLKSYVGGHASILNRDISVRKTTKSLPTLNVVYRRSALEAANGFDPDFTRVAEDLDLNYRLRRLKFDLMTEPEMKVEHALRPTLKEWLQNMALYGRGRCFFMKKRIWAFEPLFLLPALIAAAYLLTLPATLIGSLAARCILSALLILHLGGIALGLSIQAFKRNATVRIYVYAIAITWLTHLAYGASMLFEYPKINKEFE